MYSEHGHEHEHVCQLKRRGVRSGVRAGQGAGGGGDGMGWMRVELGMGIGRLA